MAVLADFDSLFPELVCPQITGWFLPEEGRLLYLLTLMNRGPILEIGHFLGRSTSVICEAIRDSGHIVQFNSYDFGFATADDFLDFYRRLYGDPEWKDYSPEEMDSMVFSKKASTTELAKANLDRFGLTEYVKLISGDFTKLDDMKYDFIFCDAMHDPEEIKHNLPFVERNSQDRCIWAFHDMKQANIETVLSLSPVKFIAIAASLGVFWFQR